MSSRASTIPSDVFDRPCSPRPPTSPPPGRSRTVPSVSPFQPIILPSSHSRPIVRRQPSQAGPSGAAQPKPFGEIGKEDDDSWERASIMSSSSWGGGGQARDGSDGEEVEKPFLPRLRNLRSARPNVRKPEKAEEKVSEVIETAKPEESVVEVGGMEGLEDGEKKVGKETEKEVEKPEDLAELAKVGKEVVTTENVASE